MWPPRRRRHRRLRTRCSLCTASRLRALPTPRISRAICLHGRPPPSPATETCYDLLHRRRNRGSSLLVRGPSIAGAPHQKVLVGHSTEPQPQTHFWRIYSPENAPVDTTRIIFLHKNFKLPPPKKKENGQNLISSMEHLLQALCGVDIPGELCMCPHRGPGASCWLPRGRPSEAGSILRSEKSIKMFRI